MQEDESYLNKRGLTHFWENIDDIKQNKLTAGAGISITNDVISATGGGTADAVDWGNIMGSMSNQTDLTTALNAKANTADLATVATSGDYDDLTDKPTIGNATLTIQKNGTTVKTFTANASTNVTANITVPTKTSDITNDSNFVASGDLATVATSGSYNDLTNKPTIPEIKKRIGASTTTNITPLYVAGDGTTTTPMALKTHGDTRNGSFAYININEPTNAITEAYAGGYVWDEDEDWWRKMSEVRLALYSDIPAVPAVNNGTLTIQKNGTNVQTFTANQSSNVTANISVPTKTSDLTNDSGFIESVTKITNAEIDAIMGVA